jgi:hypothetical protein
LGAFNFEINLENDAQNIKDQKGGHVGYYDELHLTERRKAAARAEAIEEADRVWKTKDTTTTSSTSKTGVEGANSEQIPVEETKSATSTAKTVSHTEEDSVTTKRQRVLGSASAPKAAKVARSFQ